MAIYSQDGSASEANLLKEIAVAAKESLFADEPLRQFNDQPNSRKFILGLQAIFPIFEWGRDYNLSKFKGNLIAGLTIASLCIPQDIGYAKHANLDPNSSFVPPLVYAFMGSSRDIVIGPVAVVSLLLGSLLQDEIDSSANPVESRRFAFTATFFAGLTQLLLGFFSARVCLVTGWDSSFLKDFLSHVAIVGFLAGAAITIALRQLKGLLGIKKFTKDTDIVSVMDSVISSARHGGKRQKKLFWVSAIALLISVILSTISVYTTRANKCGVHIVKNIRKGINPPSAKEIFFSGEYVGKGFKIGVISGPVVVDKLHDSKFPDLTGEERILPTVGDAVGICSSKLELDP
ncbi:hypothetical protein V6N12_010792 [Hibiscus sabdariffa]|uniref:SLC26A/SulP transporter domain-containing protein n=1 Tax=Hibiscus sabdariffa TaxID=183260 RepID=A0ABR2EL50_9ROSI